LLVRQLRDADLNIRFIATEGFCRMLMCDSTDKVDYIARLILLLFEKAPTIINADQELLVSDSREEQGYLKNSIEQFLQHYMRLSKKRSTDVF